MSEEKRFACGYCEQPMERAGVCEQCDQQIGPEDCEFCDGRGYLVTNTIGFWRVPCQMCGGSGRNPIDPEASDAVWRDDGAEADIELGGEAGGA